ncbi:hypothetical protein BDV25DRAFT_125337 [Aspergillus avenaceus]|uniref:Uncharacterized protein n=1 Tax=Aspergillus avenaceus TaxID=36643 RepID=A0A5N6TT98_ASPAV|nr:hypothetical protein BDV25DRAFT_125337 [Aspergillus avenaceus]
MRFVPILAATALIQQVPAMSIPSNATSILPEQLFLDLHIQDVTDKTTGISVVEPWATKYTESIREKRYGDAIWARYHIGGDVEGIAGSSMNMTVLDMIAEDAREYRLNDPTLYSEALSLYAQTSSEDSHAADVLALVRRIGEEDVTQLEKRKTYGIYCSTNWIAYERDCNSLVNIMSQSKRMVGNVRDLAGFGSCHLRLGPYKNSYTDLTWWTVHAVARLILQECVYVPPCCRDRTISGYSPKNGGHRKVCLSRKNTGCS